MTTLEEIEQFLLAEIAVDRGKGPLNPEEDLLEQRVIDSMAIMRLIAFLEKTFGIEVKDEDVVPENFQTLQSMVRFVEEKKRTP